MRILLLLIQSLYAAEISAGFDRRTQFKDVTDYVIATHGGCPDGIASAFYMRKALESHGVSRDKINIVEMKHTENAAKFERHITDTTAVIYTDISPVKEKKEDGTEVDDTEILSKAKSVLIIDHHGGEVQKRMRVMGEQLRSRVEADDNIISQYEDLSNYDAEECGASLVAKYFPECLPGSREGLINLVRKKDVLHWQGVADDDETFLGYSGYVDSFGYGKFTLAVFQAIHDADAETFKAMVDQGLLYKETQTNNAHALAEALKPMGVRDGYVPILGVLDDSDKMEQHDQMEFLKKARELGHHPAVLLRMDPTDLGGDPIKVRLAKTFAQNVGPDVGKISANLRAWKPAIYVSGGGHPYAAVVNVKPDKPIDQFVREMVQDMLDVFIENQPTAAELSSYEKL